MTHFNTLSEFVSHFKASNDLSEKKSCLRAIKELKPDQRKELLRVLKKPTTLDPNSTTQQQILNKLKESVTAQQGIFNPSHKAGPFKSLSRRLQNLFGRVSSGKILQAVKHTSLQNNANASDQVKHTNRTHDDESLQTSSKYACIGTMKPNDSGHVEMRYKIKISLIESGIKQIPEFHLSKFSQVIDEHLKDNSALKIKVEFVGREPGSTNPVLDTGGLARSYIDDLFAGIMESKTLSLQKTPANLHFPVAKSSKGQSPVLSQGEQEIYRDIGRLLMFCYNSTDEQSYRAGPCFESAALAGALAFTAEEIATPFNALKDESKKRCIDALLTHLMNIHDKNESVKAELTRLKTAISFLDWKPDSTAPNDKELGLLYDSWLSTQPNSSDDKCTYTTANFQADLTKIKADLPNFMKLAASAALTTKINEIGMPALGSCLAPIHQIAAGMKSVCHPGNQNPNDDIHWNETIQKIKPTDFSLKAQGSIDRNQMAKMFEYDFEEDLASKDRKEIKKKMGWLTEWIQDEKKGATDKELMLFLKFATGSSSFIPTMKIKVLAQGRKAARPDPIAHSCYNKMEISPIPCGDDVFNDRDEASFIHCLRESSLPDTGFTMQ